MKKSKAFQEFILLFAALGLVLAFAFLFLLAGRATVTDRQLISAMQLTNSYGQLTADGSNQVAQIGSKAVPALLRWSAGRYPFWYQWANPVLRLLKRPPLGGDLFAQRENALKGFFVLGDKAKSAVPQLQVRLGDTNAIVRRFSAQMLGAIGPSIGDQAFQQLTNHLSDPDSDVRNDIVWTIQFHRPDEFPVEKVLSVYAIGLQDAGPIERQNAMIGFLKMGKKAAPCRELIEKAQTDPDRGVRSIAGDLLKTLDEKQH